MTAVGDAYFLTGAVTNIFAQGAMQVQSVCEITAGMIRFPKVFMLGSPLRRKKVKGSLE